jgi:hypothetical protein
MIFKKWVFVVISNFILKQRLLFYPFPLLDLALLFKQRKRLQKLFFYRFQGNAATDVSSGDHLCITVAMSVLPYRSLVFWPHQLPYKGVGVGSLAQVCVSYATE